MKKILYFLPSIILIIYILFFLPLRANLVVLQTPDGEDYWEAFERAYGLGEYATPGISSDPIGPPKAVFTHYKIQGITIILMLMSIILKRIFNSERMEINKKTARINMVIYIILLLVLFTLTIYTTVINTTTF